MLASIQKIEELCKIENAEFLESAKILGWNVVVRVGDFKVDDLCVYCEIDSVLPEKEEFKFLKERKYRIKTIKLRGIISQGIAFPLSILPKEYDDIKIGNDVTEILEIKKYELPILISMRGKIKGDFSYFIEKTDETKIQSIPDFLEQHKGKVFYITEKLDGVSATFFINNNIFGVCSRNVELYEDDKNACWTVAREFNIEEKLRSVGKNVAIQCEVVGSRINKNIYNLNVKKLYLFSVYDIDKHKYFNFDEVIKFVKKYDLKMVPILNENLILDHTVEDLVNLSYGKSKLNPKVIREGIIVRCQIEDFDEKIGRLSFKVISPKFLLKNKE